MFGIYQLVISKHIPGGLVPSSSSSSGIWKPETVFEFHAPPISVEYRPRMAAEVTALPRGVHIETGPSFIADVEVSLQHGIGSMLSGTADGGVSIYTGRERARALRLFMLRATGELSSPGVRMEFHDHDRGYHLRVVPVESADFRMESGSMSRIGGADVDLHFVAVGNVLSGVGYLQSINDAFAGAEASLGRVFGAAGLALHVATKVVAVPANAAGVVRRAVRDAKAVVKLFQDFTNGLITLTEIPVDIMLDAADLAYEAKEQYIVAGDFFGADYWADLGAKLVDAAARVKQALFTTEADQGGAASIVGTKGSAFSQSTFQVVHKALTSGPDGIAQAAFVQNLSAGASGSFKGLLARLGSYSGWKPYIIKAGDTLSGIAQKLLGDAQKWAELALINDLNNPFLGDKAGEVIKIPLTEGGVPFSGDMFGDPAALKKHVEKVIFFVGFRLRWLPEKTGKFVDFAYDLDDPRKTLTLTGLDLYVQRYKMLIFRMDLGSNLAFPQAGVYLAIGQKMRLSTRNLTRLSAHQALLSDPRTASAVVKSARNTGDSIEVEFDVRTHAVPLALPLEV